MASPKAASMTAGRLLAPSLSRMPLGGAAYADLDYGG